MKIFGVFDKNREQSELLIILKKMQLQLNPESIFRSNNLVEAHIGVGHVFSETMGSVKQPIWNEERTKFILMSGKIFDYKKRKEELISKGHNFECPHSDAEFILHGMEEWGNNLLEMLNGFFVFLLYDTEKMAFLLVNDRCGMKPIYYFQSDSHFVFASEVKAIIEDTKVEKEINWEAWRDFFSYGFMLGNKTPFKGVFSLPPATILTFADSNLSLKRYWNYSQIKIDYETSERDFAKKGARLLKQAIKRQTSDLDEATVLLSGGCDSRFIASGLRYYSEVSFETFTTKPSFFLDSTRSIASRLFHCLDPIIAKEVATALGIKNSYIPRPYDLYEKYLVEKVYLLDGMCLEHLWILPIVENLAVDRVTFDGLTGDFFLRGALLTSESLANIGDDTKLAQAVDKYLRHYLGYPTEQIASFFKNPIREKLVPKIETLANQLEAIKNNANKVTIFYLENRTKNSNSLMPNNLVGKRTFCLFPFLDKDLVEFSLTIPPLMKISTKIYLQMLSELFPEIMKIPTTTFLSLSPASIKKIGKKYLLILPLLLIHFLIRSKSSSFRRDIIYLLKMLDSLTIPEHIDAEKTKKAVNDYVRNKKDPLPFLVPIIEFCIWYNLFMKKEKDIEFV